jgi:Uma2 family endonuclease
MASLADPFVTPEQYLEIARRAGDRSEGRFEYYDGEVVPVDSGSREHGRITLNISAELRSQLRGKPCEATTSALSVRHSPGGPYLSPDFVIVCGESVFAGERRDIILNPSVIIEVLSPSTADRDRSTKYEYYRQIESLQEYLTIAQNRVHVEHHKRQADGWFLKDYRDRNQCVEIPSISCTLNLAEVYDGIDC